MTGAGFDALIEEALTHPFTGWDFSWIAGRFDGGTPPWDYRTMIETRLPTARSLLDMGTGGGEFLSTLSPLPERTAATEAYAPNVPVARARLEPLGVEVAAYDGYPDNVNIIPGSGVGTLPFAAESFDLVINRHESYDPADVRRVLRPGGTFITQQVGGRPNVGINALLGAPSGYDVRWDLAFAIQQLEDAGMSVRDCAEAFPESTFQDVGALVYYLRAVPWHVPDFEVERYRAQLATIHETIEREGPLRVPGHYFYVIAE